MSKGRTRVAVEAELGRAAQRGVELVGQLMSENGRDAVFFELSTALAVLHAICAPEDRAHMEEGVRQLLAGMYQAPPPPLPGTELAISVPVPPPLRPGAKPGHR